MDFNGCGILYYHTGRAFYFVEETTGVYKGAFKELTCVKAEAEGYVWYRLDGTKYVFSPTGKLQRIEDQKGNCLELYYDSQGRIQVVSDVSTGRTLTFNYNVDGLLDNVSGPVTDAVPDGTWVSYGYDVNQNLVAVNYADGSGFDYSYTDPSDIHNLTEKRNKSGHLLNTWEYDDQDRVVDNFSVRGRGAGMSYVNEAQVDVTDAYGTLRTYTLADIDGRKGVSQINGSPGAPYSEDEAVRWVYDNQMRPVEVEYAGGTVNRYLDYGDRGNPREVIVAAGTPEEKIISYTFHPEMDAKLSRTQASVLGGGERATIWDFDADYDAVPNEEPTGLLSRIIEQGYTKDASGGVVPYEYITAFTYNQKGQVLSMDGPLPGDGDKTSYEYECLLHDGSRGEFHLL